MPPRTLASLLFAILPMAIHAGPMRLDVDADDGRGHVRMRHVYDGDGCRGENVAPALHWSNAPANTRGFAVTVFDPDAPTGHGWWHWIVLGLPASSRGLPAGGALPAGAFSLRNDYATRGWGGPCPPPGDPPHRYQFTVYALDSTEPGVDADAEAGQAQAWIRAHALEHARVTLTYGR